MKEETSLDDAIKDADSIVLITETDGVVNLTFSKNLDETEVLDLLSLVTSQFYLTAEESPSKLKH